MYKPNQQDSKKQGLLILGPVSNKKEAEAKAMK